MEGKKIAFIVVAIATVGGIGYYIYNKSKNDPNSVAPPIAPPIAPASKSTPSSFIKKAIAQGKISDLKAYREQQPLTAYPKNNYE